MKYGTFYTQKKTSLDLERLTVEQQNNSLTGNDDSETFAKLYRRLKKQNVKIYFTDHYGVYRDFIPLECLIQMKSQTYLIESNDFSQCHWFARFRRKIGCVSRSLHMLDLTIFLFASIDVNNSITLII